MRKNTLDYYDWIEDVQEVILANLNELLEAKSIEPLEDLHGGHFKDGKWVSVLESEDYRNYWHAYIKIWGNDLRNDSFQIVYFPDPIDDEDNLWEYCINRLRKWAIEVYNPTDPNWTDDLVLAVRKTVKENFPHDESWNYRVVFWWGW